MLSYLQLIGAGSTGICLFGFILYGLGRRRSRLVSLAVLVFWMGLICGVLAAALLFCFDFAPPLIFKGFCAGYLVLPVMLGAVFICDHCLRFFGCSACCRLLQ